MPTDMLRPSSVQSAPSCATPAGKPRTRSLFGWSSTPGLLFLCAFPVLALCASTGQRPASQQPNRKPPTAQQTEAPAVHPVVLRLSKALKDHDAHDFVRLFSKDADVRIGSRPIAEGPAGLWHTLEEPPMSESTAFHVVQKSAHAVAPDVTIVYAELVQYGSVFVRRAFPLQLIFKRQGTEWRIVSFWLPRSPVLGTVHH